MTHIALKTLRQILDGSYTVKQEILKLTFNNVETEYILTVK